MLTSGNLGLARVPLKVLIAVVGEYEKVISQPEARRNLSSRCENFPLQ